MKKTLLSIVMLRILLLLLFLAPGLLFAQDIHFQTFGVENGISQPTVTSIYQDEFGIIWIGTKDGLNRYNGTDFYIFRPVENDKHSLYNNNIGTICGDKDGHIYIRCKYAVVEYDIKKNIFHTIRDNNIQAISYGNSRLWACTRDSLFTYNRAEDKLEYYYHLEDVRLSCVTEDHEGNLYVGTMNNGLYMLDSNKKWLNYLPTKDITCIYEDSKKNIWVGTKDDGLFRLDRNGGKQTMCMHLIRMDFPAITSVVWSKITWVTIGWELLKVWINWMSPPILSPITVKIINLIA